MGPGATWGASADERSREFPCDHLCSSAEAAHFRAVTIEASADRVFRWVCQLRVAPYSYDWIDNRGRRSPQELTPGAERLAIGQTVMQIFELKHFVQGRSVTVVNRRRGGMRQRFGEVWVSYVVEPAT